MAPAHFFLALIINVVWGAHFVVLKLGLHELSPMLYAALRVAIVLVVLLPWLKWKPGNMKMLFLAAGSIGPLHFGSLFIGFKMLDDASAGAILTQLSVPFSTLLAVIFLGEKLGPWRLGGMVMAFTGVAVLSFDPKVFSYVEGVAILTLCQLFYAMGALFMRQIRGVSILEMQAWIAALAFPVLLGSSLIFEDNLAGQIADMSWVGVSCIFYSALAATIFGHGGVYLLYQRYPISTVSPLLLLGPVFGVISAVGLLGETLTLRMFLGGVLTFLGVAVVTLREAMKARARGL